jgi:hypothetical protein
MTQQTPVRLTYRGWFALTVAGLLVAMGTNLLVRDTCWTGNSYGSCEELWGINSKGKP